MEWLDRRVGSIGAPRAFILRRIWQILPPSGSPLVPPGALGLGPSELQELSEQHRLADLARAFPSRGDEPRLREIAWFGSAFGDIVCSAESPERAFVLREAAVFNLAVALFDTVVDNHPIEQASVIASALAPPALHRRLKDPSGPEAALRCADPALHRIVRLFDFVLASAGARWAGAPEQIARAWSALTAMYASEMGVCSDRMPAKTMPVSFIGILGDRERGSAMATLFERFGRLVSLLDDWHDLGSDIQGCRANSFVLAQEARGRHALPYAWSALYRLLGAEISHEGIAQTLCDSLVEAMRAAEAAGSEPSRKTRALLHHLVAPS